ncbi:MAG TPA: PaaI family thioesterase [Candidatus Binatia bacterium]|nr:PaaI family thioesterase [Candidatus Binatia bacterium]
MTTIDATLRHALEVSGRDLILTLDPALQGLPETAHGGSVLAVFDALADAATPREVSGIYRRRVPLGMPLTLLRTRADSTETFVLSDSSATVLVDGRVAPLAAATAAVVDDAPLLEAPDGGDARAHPLPVSRACFACGTDNELGLRVRLEFDADAVRGTWQPRACFRRADGSLAPAALTTLLDEAAFWLGVLATGESGMTTELRVSLHRPAPFGARVTVTGARGAVRPRGDDPRYQETEIVARADGQVVATARITFVVVRGAARRLVTGMLAINDPTCVRRVFPAYTR